MENKGFNFEAIIVDDGSFDNSKRKVKLGGRCSTLTESGTFNSLAIVWAINPSKPLPRRKFVVVAKFPKYSVKRSSFTFSGHSHES